MKVKCAACGEYADINVVREEGGRVQGRGLACKEALSEFLSKLYVHLAYRLLFGGVT